MPARRESKKVAVTAGKVFNLFGNSVRYGNAYPATPDVSLSLKET